MLSLLTLLATQEVHAQTPISQPLVEHIYTADPSAHVFNGRIYIYPSHDIESGVKEDDE
ncbi:MAG: alpha-N-arabinofuranosidase, partial [Bacteroidia bacterium]|nr:alpha-N-arabinofuranosidase [Bacteroidia bacterium]